MGNQEEVRRQANGTAADSTAPAGGTNTQSAGEGARARHRRPPRGCPQNEEHAPAFFTRKRDKQQINNPRISRNTRANIKINAININGVKATSLSQESHKWHRIHRMMDEQKIGILIVAETHMSAAQALEIEDSFLSRRLKLFNSEFPDKPFMKGVAIVLNREITNINDVQINYLIQGKAILAKIPWHGTRTMTVLGIYAPTESDEEKINFWNTYLRFTRMLGLIDGWRQCNPDTKEYTHIGSRNSLSRIDKILVSPVLMKNCVAGKLLMLEALLTTKW
jgi:exonuclease III